MQSSATGKYVFLAVLAVSLIGNAFLLSRGGSSSGDVSADSQVRSAAQVETLEFLKLFVEKVIQAPGEVSFDDRLKLENKIRELEDPELLEGWQSFVGSESVSEAESNLKTLLGLLVAKV